MEPVHVVSICLLPLVVGCLVSAVNASDEAPEQTTAWNCEGKGWSTWGTNGETVYAVSVEPEVFRTWQWTNGTLKARYVTRVDDCVGVAMISYSDCVSKVVNGGHAHFCVNDLKSDRVTHRWSGAADWFTNFGRKGSQNGKHWAACSVQDGRLSGEPDTIRFGLVAPDGKAFDWAVTITGDRTSLPEMTSPIVPSDDGTHIGVAGWKNGVMMIDVAKKKVSWAVKPEWEASTKDLAFTPDSRLIYAGGTTGCVYAMRVDTGEVLSQWWATRSGKEEYGHRISTISVSPDGRFVAAGTGPEGQVYLFSAKDGQCRILNHRGSTILITSFSPDSKRLASFAAGQIKIWKLPEEPKGSQLSKPASVDNAAK